MAQQDEFRKALATVLQSQVNLIARYLSESKKPGIVILSATKFGIEKTMLEQEAAKKGLHIVAYTMPISELRPKGWIHLILSQKPELTDREKEAIRLGGFGPVSDHDPE